MTCSFTKQNKCLFVVVGMNAAVDNASNESLFGQHLIQLCQSNMYVYNIQDKSLYMSKI